MESISLPSSPLFSTLVTLYLLILLYLPYSFLSTFLPPLLISTSTLLFLLRLGTSQQLKSTPLKGPETEPVPPIAEPSFNQPEVEPEPEPEPEIEVEVSTRVGCDFTSQEVWTEPAAKADPKLCCEKRFVGWDVGAPLEVIYEAYEGEEGREEVQNDAFKSTCNITSRVEKYPSLSRYYPESESESESDSECSSSLSWEGEVEEREGLIEIALDFYYGGDLDRKATLKKKNIVEEIQVEKEEENYDDDEDNLIEIDISPTRFHSGFCW